ncbi:MAG: hypothetical protein OXG47_04430 [bacterium]|nr:hypothetical protein [bacterium]
MLDQWLQTWHDNNLWSVNLAPELVAHDEEHAKSVERLAAEIVEPHWQPGKKLHFKPIELVWLSVASWLHDWGHCGGVLKGEDKQLRWISHSIQVRRLHGLLSQSWLNPNWKSLHGIDNFEIRSSGSPIPIDADEITVPAGILCAHHQGWTSCSSEHYITYEDDKLSPHAVHKSPSSTAGWWSNVNVKPHNLVVQYKLTVNSLHDDWKTHVASVQNQHGGADYKPFQTLLAILRLADAVDLGEHRTRDDLDTRRAQFRVCMVRELLTRPADNPAELDQATAHSKMILEMLGKHNDLNSMIDIYVRWFDEFVGKIPDDVSGYFEYIKDQQSHMEKHKRVKAYGVKFVEGTGMDKGNQLTIQITPADDLTGHEKHKHVRTDIENDMKEFLERELNKFPMSEEPLRGYLPRDASEVVIRVTSGESGAQPEHDASKDKSDIAGTADKEALRSNRPSELSGITTSEEGKLYPREATSEYSRMESVSDQSLSHSVTAKTKEGGENSTASADLMYEGSDEPGEEQWLGIPRGDWILYWLAMEFQGRDASEGVAPGELGKSLRHKLESLNRSRSGSAPFEPPWDKPGSGKALHKYLSGLDVGVKKSRHEVEPPQGRIRWEGASSWLEAHRARFGEIAARDWWNSEEAKGHVLEWVAAAFNEVDGNWIPSTTLGGLIKAGLDAGLEGLGVSGLGFDMVWGARPWEPKGVRVGNYLESLDAEISEIPRPNPPHPLNYLIEWSKSDYGRWLPEDATAEETDGLPDSGSHGSASGDMHQWHDQRDEIAQPRADVGAWVLNLERGSAPHGGTAEMAEPTL